METLNAMPAEARMDRPWRKPLVRVLSWIGAAATLLGLVLGGIEGYERYEQWRAQTEQREPLVGSTVLVELAPGGPAPNRIVTADRIVLSGGILEAPEGSVWIANSVELRDGSVIRVRDLTIVAKQIDGGGVDASGVAGTPGGTLRVAALTLSNFTVDVSGGNGVPGATGASGSNGRGGRCDGFGRWRKASAGGNGAAGGPGNDGGDGGHVFLLGPQGIAPKLKLSGGEPGAGGAGGAGGRGGRGCAGLGGTQMNAAGGSAGAAGSSGRPGKEGRYTHGALTYTRLRELVQRVTPAALPDALVAEAAAIDPSTR
jgi:hypothetical protein